MILDIFVPLPINKLFSYKSNNLEYKDIKIGNIVEVSFKNKSTIGIIWEIKKQSNFNRRIKEVNNIYPNLVLNNETLKSMEFMARYSCNTIPSLLKLFLSGFSINFYKNRLGKIKDISNKKIIKKKKKLTLSLDQKSAIDSINSLKANKFKVILLDGITSSGKTRVYMHIIRDTVKKGLQCVILVPEKILTKQWINEIKKDFALEPEIFHSSISKTKRNEIWFGVHDKKISLIIGTRSALLLPFKNLGLIVIDEEHDSSFKQEEGVIFNARDMGIVRAKNSDCRIILASATPSIETIFNCQKKKYHRIRMVNRVKKSKLPIIKIIDLKNEEKKKWISSALKKKIKINLENKKQTLIFLNKRGYSHSVICKNCGYSRYCKNCDFALVLHKKNDHLGKDYLFCHHCNFKEEFKTFCENCKSQTPFLMLNPGIERINEEIKTLFPDARICSLSSDKIKGEKELSTSINSILKGEIDIVIGTQIISKGHHFPRINTVGILNIDNVLTNFDIRSAEKAYQLITQVSGRAGREETQGEVIIQTFQPNHPVIKSLANKEHDKFIDWEIEQRKKNLQPPFSNLISIIISGINEKDVKNFSLKLCERIKKKFLNIKIFGPAPSIIVKIRNNYRWRILLKLSKNDKFQGELKFYLTGIQQNKQVNVKIDVDPINFF